MNRCTHILFAIGSALAMLLTTGCAAMTQHRHDLDAHGVVYYCDGAGGGGPLTDWGRGVRKGLEQAGYPGAFVNFRWQTGLGVGADQAASVKYKRRQAAKLADQIERFQQTHPDAPVHLIGLSAGTAVAAFALEELPVDQPVDDVVLLGSSLSEHYDLTDALRRVEHRVYVYTSEKDVVLGVLAAAAGTADRQFCGACSAGLHGFHLPHDASPQTRRLYSKIENIAWKPEFAKAGYTGGHTDVVNPKFVRQYIAPLLVRRGPRFTLAGPQPAEGGSAASEGSYE
jgi:hypothetical protein